MKTGEFRNVILCEDIREEVGNKKSLMGVFSGDIIVSEMPASLQICIYLEYMHDNKLLKMASKETPYQLEFTLQLDEKIIAKIQAGVTKADSDVTSLVVPKGIISVEKNAIFTVLASSLGAKPTEILRKTISLGDVASAKAFT